VEASVPSARSMQGRGLACDGAVASAPPVRGGGEAPSWRVAAAARGDTHTPSRPFRGECTSTGRRCRAGGGRTGRKFRSGFGERPC